jgi:Tol biopolymer transport system component
MRIFLKKLAWCLAIVILLLTACSVDVSSPPSALPTPKVEVGRETSTSPAPPVSASSPMPIAAGKVPVVWADLNLTGRLVFVRSTQTNNEAVLSIQELDLTNGDLLTLFQASSLAWIYTLSVSPDAKTLVMSYFPPAVNNQHTYQTLFQMPLDGSRPPTQLFPSPQPEDEFLQPEWSPDGQYIYFAHTNYTNLPSDSHYPTFHIFRKLFTGGDLEPIANQAFWPRLSRDGKKFVFISSNPIDGKNKIWLADPDGKNAHEVLLNSGSPDVIDAPVFSADGQAILFSSPAPAVSTSPSWIDRLLGIGVVEAHNIPSEWWQVPLAGGSPTQLTHIQASGLFASLSPDGRFFACYTADKLFVMNPDASGLRLLLDNLGGISGSVSWVP